MIYDVLMLIGLGVVIKKGCDYLKEKKQDREILKRYKEELRKKDRES